MKKLALITATLLLFISSCTKIRKDRDTDQDNIRVNGITDVSLLVNDETQLNVEILYVNSEQERVTLALENIPSGITGSISNKAGIPSFNTTLNFKNTSAAPGLYPVTLVATGEKSGRHAYTFNVRVVGCTEALVRTYFVTDNCTGGSYVSNIEAVSGQPGKIRILNFGNMGINITADVNCFSSGFGQIDIPEQTIGSSTYTGSGQYFVNFGSLQVSLFYTKMTGTTFENCSVNME